MQISQVRGATGGPTGIHGARSNIVDTNASALELLAHATGEVLYRRLAARIGSVEAGERTEQCRDDGDDLAAVRDMGSGLLEDEERGLGVDPAGRD